MTTAESPDSVAPREEGLRQLAEAPSDTEPPRRRFRTVGVFDGERDLGRRSKELARHFSVVKPRHIPAFTLLP
ncbi:hypothetical protein [Amycolatopsis sp. cmx-4-54]|uniref:hypothetical protein n=1 Tax=Amycolatopsis sp. cmx-4-54 TaxID=2790936 RepID=UPI00397C0159